VFQADAILNALWVLVCAAALLYHLRQEARRARSTSWTRICRTLAILLAAVSLFPCVSASDDEARNRYFESTQADPLHPQNGHSKKSPEQSLATLVRLLEALESVQVALIWVLTVALCFFVLVAVQWRAGIESFLVRRPGRSPPFIICHA
jgi:hypothetical protein